jgi:hypothetical protein
MNKIRACVGHSAAADCANIIAEIVPGHKGRPGGKQ